LRITGAIRLKRSLSNHGDCEDHAILKYAALLEAGIPKDDVKIVTLKNFFPNDKHAAVATRVDGQRLILDNRTLTLVRDTDVTRAIPEFVLDSESTSWQLIHPHGLALNVRLLIEGVP
jgi:predicted transglutaminase-like cysteine proteinase